MIPLRLYLYAAAGTILLTSGIWYRHHLIEAGEAAGEARIHAQWAADTARRDSADAAIRAQNAAREAQARQHNDEVVNDYAQKLAAAAGSRDEYFRLLQRARQVHPVPAPEAGGAASPVAAGQNPSPDGAGDPAERVDRAIAAVIAEHRANSEQLNALIAVIKPQLLAPTN